MRYDALKYNLGKYRKTLKVVGIVGVALAALSFILIVYLKPIPTLTPPPTIQVVAQLTGPPDDAANAHIPDIPFPDPDAADFTTVDDVPISRRTFLLIFKDETTVAQANDLLQALNAQIIGGIDDAALLYIRLPDMPLEQTIVILDSLQEDGRVGAAVMDIAGEQPLELPPHNVTPNLWTWEVPNYPKGPAATGNWGLELIRAPQMWNLDTFVRRHRATINVCAGAIEPTAAPQKNHPDLSFDDETPKGNGDHMTMISGIIGARWNNMAGVEGVNPWLEGIYARPRDFPIVNQAKLFEGLLNEILGADNCIVAVNYSAGFHINIERPPSLSDTFMKALGRTLNNAVTNWSGKNRQNFFLVGAAGNGGNARQAQWNSLITNAAIQFKGRFLAVESIDWNNKTSKFSNLAGSISAPGECIRSTEAKDGNVDDNYKKCVWIDTDRKGSEYGTGSGTSLAAPHVSGLITALWKLEPNLTIQEIRTLITGDAYIVNTTGGTKPRIDAFAAVMGIDVLRKNQNLQKALVDVDDGTLDGNLRMKAFDTDPNPDTIHTGDKLRGDGKIDMRDFRAFRDAYLDAQNVSPRLLDGPDAHFKKDLNLDGCVGTSPVVSPGHPAGIPTPGNCANAPVENVFPRYDFNGDGRITATAVNPAANDLAPFKVDPDIRCQGLNKPSGCLRDIDVLADSGLWKFDKERVSLAQKDEKSAGNGQWNETGLLLDRNGDGFIDYLRSIDLHLDLDMGASAKIDIYSLPGAAGHTTFAKMIENPPTGKQVITVPVVAQKEVFIYYSMEKGNEFKNGSLTLIPKGFGEDFKLRLTWDKLELFPVREVPQDVLKEIFPPDGQHQDWNKGLPGFDSRIGSDWDDLRQQLQEKANQLAQASQFNQWLKQLGAQVAIPTKWFGRSESVGDGVLRLYLESLNMQGQK